MDGLPADHAQSWFLVKVAVAFSPTLTLWAADVIGRYLWAYGGLARRLTRAGTHTANLRKLWDRRATPLPRRKPGNPGGDVGPQLVNRPRGNMASGVWRGHLRHGQTFNLGAMVNYHSRRNA